MKKRISFGYILNNTILFIGMIISMLILSFFLVSITFYSQENQPISYEKTIAIYNEDKVNDFHAYFNKDTLIIFFSCTTKQTELFLIEYGLYYFDEFKIPIYMEVNNAGEVIYITINNEGVVTIS